MATLTQLKKQYKEAKEAYYNGTSILSDADFDALEDRIRYSDPDWKELKKTGVPVKNKKTETLLWRYMPSLRKMYDVDVSKFYKSFNAPIRSWLWADKLDGTSLQLVYTEGEPSQLITRGDGTKGGDISFFIPHLVKLKKIPATIPDKSLPLVFRLEGIMKKAVFEKKWSKKALGEKAGSDNARNLVNGLFNRMDMSPALADVDLVVLGVFDFALEEGLQKAKKWKFKTAPYTTTGDKVGHREWLAQRRESSEYEIDGFIVASIGFRMIYEDAEKPTAMVAYKFNDEENAAECKVKRIIYQTSGFGRIVPTVEIEPTRMDGATIKHCTVHNAKWMLDRHIGPGAIVKMVRSGGVIPKIIGVVKKGKIQLPEVPHELKGVNFIALENSKEQDIRVIDRFLTTLGVEFIAEKTIAALYDVDWVSPRQYIAFSHFSTEEKVLKHLQRGGLGPNQSIKVLNELKRVLCNEISLKKLMVASSCFDAGVGEKRLSAIEAAGISMESLLSSKFDPEKSSCDDLYAISGFATKTVELIVKGVLEFETWFADVGHYLTVNADLPKPKKKKTVSGKLNGVTITLTGYRDHSQVTVIESLGGTVADFSAKTDILLYREGGRKSSKIEKAGDKAFTWVEFCKRYGVN